VAVISTFVHIKGKGKGQPITAHECPEWGKEYSSTISSTSALDRGRVVNATTRPIYIRWKTWYPLYRRHGGPQVPMWTGAENLAFNGIRSPDRPARSVVRIPTELSRPLNNTKLTFMKLCNIRNFACTIS
jgi:hypothetical protein